MFPESAVLVTASRSPSASKSASSAPQWRPPVAWPAMTAEPKPPAPSLRKITRGCPDPVESSGARMSISPSLSMSPRSNETNAGAVTPGKPGTNQEIGAATVPFAFPKKTSNRRVPMQPTSRSVRPSIFRSAAMTSCGLGMPPLQASTRIRSVTARFPLPSFETMAKCELP